MKYANRFPLLASLSILGACSAASATAVSGQGTWETTLQARDFNSDGTADGFYDTSTNLTWLADANFVKTSGYKGFPNDSYPDLAPQPSGAVNWFVASAWGPSLNVYGVTGWRLPSLVNQNSCAVVGSHASCQAGVKAGSSELENLIETTLGNTNGLTNTGPFQNVQADFYWTGTQTTAWPGGSVPYWVYNTSNGIHSTDHGQNFGVYAFAWVLHDGDIGTAIAVPSVPEPSSYAMTLCGLAAVAWAVRRKHQRLTD